MPETLILHLGLHKTATTALQDFLAGERQGAARARRRLPAARADALGPDAADRQRAAKPDRAALARFVDKVRQPVLLLSDENILGAPGDIARRRALPLCREPGPPLLRPVRRPAHPAVPDAARARGLPRLDVLRVPAAQPLARLRRLRPRLRLEGFAYAAVFDWLFALPRHVAVTVTPFEAARGGGVRVIAERLLEAACGPGHGIDPAASPRPARASSYSVEELELAATIAARADAKTAQIFLNMLDSRDRRFGATRFDAAAAGDRRGARGALRAGPRGLRPAAGLSRRRGAGAAEPDRRGLDPRRAGARARRRAPGRRAPGVDYPGAGAGGGRRPGGSARRSPGSRRGPT